MAPIEPTDPIEPIDPAEPIEPIDPAQPIEPIDPAEPTERIDPVEPIDRIDPVEPIDSSERRDAIDQRPRFFFGSFLRFMPRILPPAAGRHQPQPFRWPYSRPPAGPRSAGVPIPLDAPMATALRTTMTLTMAPPAKTAPGPKAP
jgi:hypothetical protein